MESTFRLHHGRDGLQGMTSEHGYTVVHDSVYIFTFFLLVIVKSFTTLLSQPSCIDHLLEQHCGPVLGITRVVVQDLHDRQTSIDADEIRQL